MVANVVLISADPALEESVSQAIASIQDCRVSIARCADEIRAMECPIAPLLVFHLASVDDEQQISRFLEESESAHAHSGVVVVTDSYDPSQALAFLRKGAVDYLARPLDLRRLALLAEVITWRHRHGASRCVVESRGGRPSRDNVDEFIAGDPVEVGPIMDQVQKVAPFDTTILVTGETGTGKSRLARLIHEHSPRAEHPLVTISCGAMSSSIAESELFGHAKGAYTGAEEVRVGKCEAAAGGTLVLDDIDALPLEIQAKLLRVVDERVFEPVGSNRTVEFRARLIVATNRSLKSEMATGRFRQDLFYRLNVAPIHIPPLRERRSAIRPLIETWLVAFCMQYHLEVASLSDRAVAALTTYDWPGNIRELRNVIERIAAFAQGQRIELSDLPEEIQAATPAASTPVPSREELTGGWLQERVDSEVRAILNALTASKNNRSRAARVLGISRPTLYKKMHQYGLI